jgi:hypothetical protein
MVLLNSAPRLISSKSVCGYRYVCFRVGDHSKEGKVRGDMSLLNKFESPPDKF